jgi:hypothetical protein
MVAYETRNTCTNLVLFLINENAFGVVEVSSEVGWGSNGIVSETCGTLRTEDVLMVGQGETQVVGKQE